MVRSRHSRISPISGFSLVELLVAMIISLVGSIIIFQVFAGFENQRRNTTSGGDATTNMAAAANALEQAGRDAGYGLNFGSHLGCAAIGWRENADPTITPHAAGKIFALKVAPVSIDRDAGGALLSLTFSRNTNDNSYSVTKLISNMDPVTPSSPSAATANAPLCLENMYGVNKGDILVLAEHKDTDTGSKATKITCAVTEVRDIIPGPPVCINHTYGSFTHSDPAITAMQYTNFNKPGGLGSIPDTGSVGADLNSLMNPIPYLDSAVTNAPNLFTFKAGAAVMNLGPKKSGGISGFQTSQFSLQNGQLMVSSFPGDPGVPLVDGIVFMEAQFGSASTPTTTSPALTYSKTLPEVATNDPKIAQDTWFSLRTVRVVMITKSSQYDKDYNGPTTFTAWSADGPLAVTYTAPNPAVDTHYRHKVWEVVIPLRNMFWRP